MCARVGRRPSHFSPPGRGYDHYGSIGELNFVGAPFDPMVGSSPRPGLIKRLYAAYSADSYQEHRRSKYRQTSDLAGETGGARTSAKSA